jgi:hypothetical protein
MCRGGRIRPPREPERSEGERAAVWVNPMVVCLSAVRIARFARKPGRMRPGPHKRLPILRQPLIPASYNFRLWQWRFSQ